MNTPCTVDWFHLTIATFLSSTAAALIIIQEDVGVLPAAAASSRETVQLCGKQLTIYRPASALNQWRHFYLTLQVQSFYLFFHLLFYPKGRGVRGSRL